MRLLEPAQSEAVLSETCRFIQENTPFKLSGGCEQHVQVITGEEEGLLGWIAINYLMDGFHFRSAKPALPGGEASKGQSTYGFLDMGGASTQIAFEPGKAAIREDQARPENLTDVTLRLLDGTEVTHKVFVTTFLGFGTNKARERYVEATVANHSSNSVDAVSGLVPDPCLPIGLELPASQSSNTSLVGAGSFTSCLAATAPLLEKDAPCLDPPCLFHGVHVPAIDFTTNHFIGVSEYWFSSNDVFGLGGVYDFVSFQRAAMEFCGHDWKTIAADLASGSVYGPQVELSRLQMQCFKAAWMTTVLHEGIGIPRIMDPKGKGDGKSHAAEAQGKADEKNLFQSVNDVDGLGVSWTLGKAVLEAIRGIPASLPVGGVAAPEPTPWRDAWPPSWHRPADGASLSSLHVSRSVPPVALLVACFLTLALFATCLLMRGRGPRALRRRAALRDLLPPPLGSMGGLMGPKRGARGDYVLASMEEGGDSDGAEFVNPVDGWEMDGEYALSGSEGSSEEAYGKPSSPRLKAHRRRRSSNGILASLALPLRRLAFSISSAVPWRRAAPAVSLSRRPSRVNLGLAAGPIGRGTAPGRKPLRRSTSSPVVTQGSPSFASIGGAISRPASRAGTPSRTGTPTGKLPPHRLGGLARAGSPAGSTGVPHTPHRPSSPAHGLFGAWNNFTPTNASGGGGEGALYAPNASYGPGPLFGTPASTIGTATATGSAYSSRAPSRVSSPAPMMGGLNVGPGGPGSALAMAEARRASAGALSSLSRNASATNLGLGNAAAALTPRAPHGGIARRVGVSPWEASANGAAGGGNGNGNGSGSGSGEGLRSPYLGGTDEESD